MSIPTIPGWFGKLPCLGDFASRRLPAAFVRPWDDWLQQALLAAREALGERYLAGYLEAPIWRFWLSPGLLGERGWAGLLMPSADRVGRYYPLALAWPGDSLADVLQHRRRFDRFDEVVRQVLDMDFTVDDFERELARAAAHPPTPGDDAIAAPRADPWVERDAAAPASLWWIGPIGAGRPRRFAGLPPHEAVAAWLEARP